MNNEWGHLIEIIFKKKIIDRWRLSRKREKPNINLKEIQLVFVFVSILKPEREKLVCFVFSEEDLSNDDLVFYWFLSETDEFVLSSGNWFYFLKKVIEKDLAILDYILCKVLFYFFATQNV
jgi:hypothetical protein